MAEAQDRQQSWRDKPLFTNNGCFHNYIVRAERSAMKLNYLISLWVVQQLLRYTLKMALINTYFKAKMDQEHIFHLKLVYCLHSRSRYSSLVNSEFHKYFWLWCESFRFAHIYEKSNKLFLKNKFAYHMHSKGKETRLQTTGSSDIRGWAEKFIGWLRSSCATAMKLRMH